MKDLTGNPDETITGLDGDDVPACVHNVLANWDELAFAAYDWYVKHGG